MIHKDRQLTKRLESGRRRGWIIYFLFIARPKPLSFNMLHELLDKKDLALTWEHFGDKIDYLRSKGFIKVFKGDVDRELSNIEQSKLIQQFCENYGDGVDVSFACLTTHGIDYQEGAFDDDSIQRIHGT